MTKLPHPQECTLYHDLWTDRSWVHRRIDEISFTERGMMQVKSTFDLDIAYLKKKISKLPKRLRKGDQIALPLMALPRTLLLDIDVTLDGKAQSFAGKETSAELTHCIYLQEYFSKHIADTSHCKKNLVTKKWPSESFDEMQYVSDFICHWFEQGNSGYAEKRLAHITNQLDELKQEVQSLQREEEAEKDISQNISALHEKLITCSQELSILARITTPHYSKSKTIKPYQWEQWSRFSKDYIAVVLIDIPSDRGRAKLTYVTKTDFDYQEDVILPIRAFAIPVECRSLLGSGVEERYHFRINAPEGHYISSLMATDIRNDSKVLFQPGEYLQNKCSTVDEDTESIKCKTADGANLTFLEIKDGTIQDEGNIFGSYLRIGIEPFSKAFMLRALVGMAFLLFYLMISKFIQLDIGKVAPFSIAALGFLASSPLWFRIGSEDAFTHRTLRRGRTILGWLAAAVFLTSFGTQLITSEEKIIHLDEAKVELLKKIISNSWCCVLFLCILYTLGILWFFIRTYIQRRKFSNFLEILNSENLNELDMSSPLMNLQRDTLRVMRLLSVLILLSILCSTFLAVRYITSGINDTFELLLNDGKYYMHVFYGCIYIIFLRYAVLHLFTLRFWDSVTGFAAIIFFEILHPTNAHHFRS